MINGELSYQVRKLRKDSKRYSFLLNDFLEERGLIKNHELEGKTIIKKENNKEYIIENVYLHYCEGYYYMLLAHDKNKSTTQICWNVNSEGIDIDNYDKYYLKDYHYEFAKDKKI